MNLGLGRLVPSPGRLLVFSALVSAAALCIAVLGVGLLLSRPATAEIGAPPLDLPVENVTFLSDSGAALRGWFVAGRPRGGAVVLMHGVRANRMSMVERARILHASGFSVLLFDFQAHGESPGKRITFGYLEALDAEAAVAFARQRLPGERIGAVGTSLGGAAALLGPAPLPVDALVLESVYPDIRSATANRIRAVVSAQVGPLVGVHRSRAYSSWRCRQSSEWLQQSYGQSTISPTLPLRY